jgi:hypothetical protein
VCDISGTSPSIIDPLSEEELASKEGKPSDSLPTEGSCSIEDNSRNRKMNSKNNLIRSKV